MTSNNKCNPCRCGEAEGEPLKGQMAVVDRDGRENASKCQELGQVPIRQVPVSEVPSFPGK